MARTKHVDFYVDQIKNKEIIVNEERHLLVEWIEKNIYPRDDMWFDEETIEDCISFIEKWFFILEPFQKFLISFVFLLYKGKKKVVFNKHFWTLARGAGKNGLASGLSAYLISPRYGVKGYNIGIVATSEEQAMTSVEEVYGVVDDNDTLKKWFKHTATRITSKLNRNWFKYYTSNAKTKDGARLGAIFFDEIHEYVTNDIINVFQSGFGKRAYSRRFYIGTTGHVRDGVFDNLMQRAMDILTGVSDDMSFFPFVCRLDKIQEMENPDLWQKANPMFHEPMSEYAETLKDEVLSDYKDLAYGGDKIEFIVKRMNFDDIDGQENVATKKDIQACNVPLPDLTGQKAIGALDLSSNKDFTSAGVILRDGPMYYWKTYSFVPRSFLNNYKLSVPIEESRGGNEVAWNQTDFQTKRGPLLEVVEEVDIPIEYVVEWFIKQREIYDLNTIVIDWYRQDYAKKALEAEGFEVIVVRKSAMIASSFGLRIQSLFSRGYLNWGINPMMNWYTNNVKVGRDKFDNITFEKKEKKRRKIDGFMAMSLAIWQSDELLEAEPSDFMLEGFWD